MNLQQLETFVWVADLSSFRGAAERLNTTQPNVSARIASLEAVLGGALFTRTTSRVTLTPRGGELLVHARAILAANRELIAAAQDPALLSGRLKLGVTEVVAYSWLSRFLAAFNAAHPAVRLELTVDLSTTLSKALLAKELDLCFQTGPFLADGLVAEPLSTHPLVWVGKPGADLSLEGQSLFLSAKGTEPHRALLAAFPDATFRLIPSSNLAACVPLIEGGAGIGLLPLEMIPPTLRCLPITWTPPPLACFARFATDRINLPIERAVAIAHKESLSMASE